MTLGELIEKLQECGAPLDASVYVDLQQVDCFGIEDVDTEDDDGEVTVYLTIKV